MATKGRLTSPDGWINRRRGQSHEAISRWIFFAVLWTLGMVIWEQPSDVAGIVRLAIVGVMTGVVFHLAMAWWVRRQARRSPSA